MKNKLITIASALALLVVLARVFERPLLAQIRAALTQNVDEPGRNPFSLNSPGLPGERNIASWTVPAGKRYVVEQFTVDCAVPAPTSMSIGRLYTINDGFNETTTAAGHFQEPASGGGYIYAATGTTHLYADAGSKIYALAANGDGTEGNDTCVFYVNGYAINNP